MKTKQVVDKAIVFDLDGVIADIDSSMSDWLHNTGVRPEEMNYGQWLISNTNDEDVLKIFNNPLFWVNMKPYLDAWYQVNYWFSLGYEIHIVTARRQVNAVEQTLPWLEKWNINSRPPHFSPFGKKIEIIKNIDPIFVVEDNPSEIDVLQAAGVKCYLRKQWYNADHWEKYDSIDTLFDIKLDEPVKRQF